MYLEIVKVLDSEDVKVVKPIVPICIDSVNDISTKMKLIICRMIRYVKCQNSSQRARQNVKL